MPKLNKSNSCFNCGTELLNEENYCPNCGQKNTDLNISIWEILKEFAGDYFTFDSKLFRTIGPLLFKPGKVPKEFIDGKRVTHIPPLRVFIFLSFITFFFWGLTFSWENDPQAKDTFQDSLSELNDQQIIDSLNEGNNAVNLTIDDDTTTTSLQYLLDKEIEPQEIVDSLVGDQSQIIQKLTLQGLRMWRAEEGSVTQYFLGNMSIVLLLLQPFIALLLKLVYIRRKEFFYIEHLVFSLYYHSFILLLSVILAGLSLLIDGDYLFLPFFFISFLYFFLAAKRFYEQGWMKTFFKSMIVSFIYGSILFPIGMLIYLLLGVYFY